MVPENSGNTWGSMYPQDDLVSVATAICEEVAGLKVRCRFRLAPQNRRPRRFAFFACASNNACFRRRRCCRPPPRSSTA